MKKLILLCLFSTVSFAHVHHHHTHNNDYKLLAGPYLQKLGVDSVTIMWESPKYVKCEISFGELNSVRRTSSKDKMMVSTSGTIMNEFSLTGLKADTVYRYGLNCQGKLIGPFKFKTAPTKEAVKKFKFAVYSDIQNRADVHEAIIKDGLLKGLPAYASGVEEDYAFIMLPGDIANVGLRVKEYRKLFFEPAREILPYLPVYPVVGNHDRPFKIFNDYFQFPNVKRNNHSYYYFDYNNIKVIGLDTETARVFPKQLLYLNKQLRKACKDDAIDFVFVQYHRPHKSELWTVGNSFHSGLINSRVKKHLKKCNKAGAVFFGHTHGYSRGTDSHTHLFKVNVGGAGGHLDYWGKHNKDYKDFTKSLDEHGFMIFDVESGDNPKFKGTRWGLGDKFVGLKPPHVRDEFEYRKHNHAPATPEILASEGGKKCFNEFHASEFGDVDGDTHYSTEWKVQKVKKIGSLYIPFGRAKQEIVHYENIYNGNKKRPGWDVRDDYDTMAGKSINAIKLKFKKNKDYRIRVRHRDSSLKWSHWSRSVYYRCQ
jgi:hypothetical protein